MGSQIFFPKYFRRESIQKCSLCKSFLLMIFFFFFSGGRKCFFLFFLVLLAKKKLFSYFFIHSIIFVWLRKHFLPQKCETNLKITPLLVALCSSWCHVEVFPSSKQRGDFPWDWIPLVHPELPLLAWFKRIPVPEVGPCLGAELPGAALLGLPYSSQPFPALPIHLPRLRAMDGSCQPRSRGVGVIDQLQH